MAEAEQPEKRSPEPDGGPDAPVSDDLSEAPLATIPPGTILVGRYRTVSVLGVGAMGTVYLAEHLNIGRTVALKVLNADWSAHGYVARRFREEARSATAIGHPGIVEVYDAGELPDERLFLVMEHLEGHTVAEELAVYERIAPARTCEILRQTALALCAAHEAGIIHRDLKPGNLMIATIQGEERIKILDFGVACNLSVRSARDRHRLTMPGVILGTPEYMAPEQSTGEQPTPRFDLYALGAIAFEMLTGDPPLVAEHSFELLARKRRLPAPSLGDVDPHLHPDLVRLVDACLSIDPAARPVDALDFVDRLDAFIDDVEGGETDRGPATTRGGAAGEAAPEAAESAAEVAEIGSGRVGIGVLAGLVAIAVAVVWIGASMVPSDVPAAVAVSRPREPHPPPPPPPPPPPAPDEPAIPEATAAGPTPEDREAEPEPAKTRPRERAKARTRPPAADERAHDSAECARIRGRAEWARDARAWSTLRDLSRRSACWERRAEARKLETQAAMELLDFAGCVSAGTGSSDPQVQRWTKLCRLRME